MKGKSLAKAVDKQSWDASVKALTQFPSVLDNLAKNLTWTSTLGEAFHNQHAEVMAAIQTLRAKAKATGNLKSSPQITVMQQSPQVIVIQPANPQVVYVPEYNPAVIYGTPYVTPGYSAGDVAAAGILGFGAGIAVGTMMSGGGWGAWGCDWHGGAVVYNHNTFIGNAAWHGGYYNSGYHGYHGSYNDGYHGGYNNAYDRTNVGNSYRGGGNTYNNFSKQGAQNFSNHNSGASSWGQHDSGASRSNAFSGMSGHSNGFGGSGGWSSRAASSRGWGSMRSGGFGGGRFGGFGGGRFGGGGFRGGGRR